MSASAFDNEPKTTNEQIREKIVNLLGKKFKVEIKKEKQVEISFVFNTENEIVILSVDKNDAQLTNIVKQKLNYKTLDVKGIKKGEIYTLPLKLKKA